MELIPLVDIKALRAAGLLWPKTAHAWRWLFRTRHAKGLDGAFVEVSRRVLVNVPALKKALVSQKGMH